MGAIGKGDWVECIRSARPERVGRIFEVLGIGPPNRCRNCGHCAGLELSGQRLTSGGGWWCVNAYRPVYSPKQEIIEALKAPPLRAPKREREEA